MTEKTANKKNSGSDERDVVIYLKEHPDFFQHNEALLTDLQLPHPDTGEAISLLERQVALLRQQKQELSRKLQHLAQVARGNEQVLERMQRLILDLIDSPDIDTVFQLLDAAMRADFHADAVALRLFSAERSGPVFVAPHDPVLEEFTPLLQKRQPVCGYLPPAQKAFLFGARAEEMSSGAIIPLCEGSGVDCVGLLGVGSVDPKRFHPEMGTVFLAHLGAVAARIIQARWDS